MYTTNDSAVATVERFNAWELETCDEAKDGMRSRAELRNLTTGRVIATAEDANGSDNYDCGFSYANPVPRYNEKRRLTVWVQDGAGGTRRFLDYVDFTA